MKLKYILLSSIIIVFNISFVSLAVTCDDIRQLYGEQALDTDEYHSFIDYVDTLGELKMKRESAISLLEAKTNLEAIYKKYDELSIERNDIRDNVADLMKSNGDTVEIIGKVKQLISVEDKLSSLNLDDDDFVFDEETDELQVSTDNYDILNAQIGNNRNYLNDRYDVGELGKVWPVAVTTNKKVYKGFGVEGSETGVYISKSGANRVLSLFTGIVTKKEHSDVYGDWVEIQSGKGLKTTYSYLSNIRVNVGDKVYSGDIISDIDKDSNYIFLELILDEEYKNPMLVMGETGVKANNQWIYENVGFSSYSELLSMDSYDYIPAQKIWDAKNEVEDIDDNIITIK